MNPEVARFIERQHNPKFELIEAHFGHPVPNALKALYKDTSQLDERDFTITIMSSDGARQWFIGDFSPIDEESLKFFPGFEKYLEIANDASEGLYFIDPTQPDPEVLYFDMESYEVTPCGAALSVFLTAPRRPGYPEEEET